MIVLGRKLSNKSKVWQLLKYSRIRARHKTRLAPLTVRGVCVITKGRLLKESARDSVD